MNHSILSNVVRKRLTPQVLEFLQRSGHSVTIWNIDPSPYSFVTVSYDETDLLTALWVHDRCFCHGGGQFHAHLCPADIRHYWKNLQLQGFAIKPPYQITFSTTRAQPYDCPHLNELRAQRFGVVREALLQRPCLLPGPSSSNVIRPPPALRRLFPGLFALPEAPADRQRPIDLALGSFQKFTSAKTRIATKYLFISPVV